MTCQQTYTTPSSIQAPGSRTPPEKKQHPAPTHSVPVWMPSLKKVPQSGTELPAPKGAES